MKFTIEYEMDEKELIDIFTSIYGENDYEGKTKQQIVNMFNCFCQGYLTTSNLQNIKYIVTDVETNITPMEMDDDEIFDRIMK